MKKEDDATDYCEHVSVNRNLLIANTFHNYVCDRGWRAAMLKDVIVSIHGKLTWSIQKTCRDQTLRVRLTTTMILENSTLYSLQFEVIGPNRSTHFILLAYFMRVLTYGSAAIKSSPTPRSIGLHVLGAWRIEWQVGLPRVTWYFTGGLHLRSYQFKCFLLKIQLTSAYPLCQSVQCNTPTCSL